MRSRRPRNETTRYERTPSRLALFTAPPRDKVVYSIGELVAVAYERAALLADDATTESVVATRLLAEWLASATSTVPAGRTPGAPGRSRRVLPLPQARAQSPSRRRAFASSPGWRAAA